MRNIRRSEYLRLCLVYITVSYDKLYNHISDINKFNGEYYQTGVVNNFYAIECDLKSLNLIK